jgi:hypothetical protein
MKMKWEGWRTRIQGSLLMLATLETGHAKPSRTRGRPWNKGPWRRHVVESASLVHNSLVFLSAAIDV